MSTRTTSKIALALGGLGFMLAAAACTQEQQNKLRRDVQNWTGTNGVLEIYAGDKLVRRFVKVDKLSTASAPVAVMEVLVIEASIAALAPPMVFNATDPPSAKPTPTAPAATEAATAATSALIVESSVLVTDTPAIVADDVPSTEVETVASVVDVMMFSAKAPAALTATPTAPKPAANDAEADVD